MSPSRLQEEIKQTRPFTSSAHEAAVAIARTADRLRRKLTIALEPAGITLQQFNVLRILRGAGSEGLPTLEVRARMVEDTPAITGLLDRLEAKSLVRRERCVEDRRQVFCRIAAAGRELLARADDPVHRSEQEALARLDEAERNELLRLLDKIRQAAG